MSTSKLRDRPTSDEQVSRSDVFGDRNICLVTGGAGALGEAVCRCLAESGAHVIIVDIGKKAESLARTFADAGLRANGSACDVSDKPAVEALRDEVRKQHGGVDALICLAGIARNAKLEDITTEDFNLTMSSHVSGTLNVIQAFAPEMKKRGYGRVVTTSSVAARGTIAGTSYAAAKGAIEAITRTAAVELARFGIAVNCVAPGGIAGGMFQRQPEKAREHMISRTPMRRLADPAEVAVCYRFLASPQASFVTGQTLYVCGGASVGAFL